MKTTKGTWKVDRRAGMRVECNGITVARCSNSQSGDNYEECCANAQLISAAPELLKALKFCKSVIVSAGVFDRSEEIAIEMAEIAINKAEGHE